MTVIYDVVTEYYRSMTLSDSLTGQELEVGMHGWSR